jgi:hypothetical protein
VEKVVQGNEDMMTDLDDEMGDLEHEGRWLNKWRDRDREWAELEARALDAERSAERTVAVFAELQEEQTQLKVLHELQRAQDQREAFEEALAAASATMQVPLNSPLIAPTGCVFSLISYAPSTVG